MEIAPQAQSSLGYALDQRLAGVSGKAIAVERRFDVARRHGGGGQGWRVARLRR